MLGRLSLRPQASVQGRPRRGQDGPDDAPAADALVLSSRDRPPAPRPAGVAVMVADCVPLLLAADDGTIVAAVHAGRRGMLTGVVTAAFPYPNFVSAYLPICKACVSFFLLKFCSLR